MSPVPAVASTAEAVAAARAALRFVAATDAAQMPVRAQAGCLRDLERAGAVLTAARARVAAGFTAARGYSADADYSPRTWLMHQTRISRAAAAGHAAWARRAAAHGLVLAAMAAGQVSESYGAAICGWTGKLPEQSRAAADEILLAAAAAGMDLGDLARLAAEMYERSRPDRPEEDPGPGFDDRAVRLETTFGGAGWCRGT